jgi:hypothetical protein
MNARDARFLLHELLLIASFQDDSMEQAVKGAISMGSIEARPTSFHTALTDGGLSLSVTFHTAEGPKKFRIDITEAD